MTAESDTRAVEGRVRVARPYTVILNGRSHDGDSTLGIYENVRRFANHKAAYGCALDFVIHGPIHNTALVRLNDKPFLRIERKGGHVTMVKVNWTGENDD